MSSQNKQRHLPTHPDMVVLPPNSPPELAGASDRVLASWLRCKPGAISDSKRRQRPLSHRWSTPLLVYCCWIPVLLFPSATPVSKELLSLLQVILCPEQAIHITSACYTPFNNGSRAFLKSPLHVIALSTQSKVSRRRPFRSPAWWRQLRLRQ